MASWKERRKERRKENCIALHCIHHSIGLNWIASANQRLMLGYRVVLRFLVLGEGVGVNGGVYGMGRIYGRVV